MSSSTYLMRGSNPGFLGPLSRPWREDYRGGRNMVSFCPHALHHCAARCHIAHHQGKEREKTLPCTLCQPACTWSNSATGRVAIHSFVRSQTKDGGCSWGGLYALELGATDKVTIPQHVFPPSHFVIILLSVIPLIPYIDTIYSLFDVCPQRVVCAPYRDWEKKNQRVQQHD